MSAKKINGPKARLLLEKNGVLVDVRSPVNYRDGSLPGAVNMPLRTISLLKKYPLNTKLVFFGESEEDDNLKAAMNYAFQFGFTDIYNLGSIESWNEKAQTKR